MAVSLIWATLMKTTIELPDALIEQARRQSARQQLDFPSYGSKGLTDEFQGAPWGRIRDEIYREHGA